VLHILKDDLLKERFRVGGDKTPPNTGMTWVVRGQREAQLKLTAGTQQSRKLPAFRVQLEGGWDLLL
jgi:hypothetical protein